MFWIRTFDKSWSCVLMDFSLYSRRCLAFSKFRVHDSFFFASASLYSYTLLMFLTSLLRTGSIISQGIFGFHTLPPFDCFIGTDFFTSTLESHPAHWVLNDWDSMHKTMKWKFNSRRRKTFQIDAPSLAWSSFINTILTSSRRSRNTKTH